VRALLTHPAGNDTSGRADTPPPPVVQSGLVQIADATGSAAPPKLSAAAVAEDVSPVAIDHVEATSALKQGDGEFSGNSLQGASAVPDVRGGEHAEHPQGAIPDEFALDDPAPIAIEPVTPPALATPDAAPPLSAVTSQAEIPPAPPARRLTETEAKAFLDRADSRLRVGDIGGARRLLEYAGSGGSGEALLLLATTYDPAALAGWGARSVRPDPEVARALYQRALELGMTGAQERLAALPSAE
jgi:hypothetical protein